MSGLDIVDGARADDHEQAMILAVEDVAYHLTAMGHGLQCGIGQGDFAFELIGGDQGFVGSDVEVVDR